MRPRRTPSSASGQAHKLIYRDSSAAAAASKLRGSALGGRDGVANPFCGSTRSPAFSSEEPSRWPRGCGCDGSAEGEGSWRCSSVYFLENAQDARWFHALVREMRRRNKMPARRPLSLSRHRLQRLLHNHRRSLLLVGRVGSDASLAVSAPMSPAGRPSQHNAAAVSHACGRRSTGRSCCSRSLHNTPASSHSSLRMTR